MNYIFLLLLVIVGMILYIKPEKYRGTYEGSLDSVYADVHPTVRVTDYFGRCSPQSLSDCKEKTWP